MSSSGSGFATLPTCRPANGPIPSRLRLGVRLALGLWVGVPLAGGVEQTVRQSLKLFR